jgi:hypothetical protein
VEETVVIMADLGMGTMVVTIGDIMVDNMGVDIMVDKTGGHHSRGNYGGGSHVNRCVKSN